MIGNTPWISVVMAVFNGQPYLSQAIESILNQAFEDFEFVIVDDGSTDQSLEIIQSYAHKDKRIRVIQNETNIGHSLSLNRGILAANGKFIARMDADDISLPQRLEKQFHYLRDNPEIDLCGTSYRELINSQEGDLVILPASHPEIKCSMLFYCPISHPTVMWRREKFMENDFFYSSSFKRANDYDLWVRCIDRIRFSNINEVLMLYRIHKGQATQAFNDQMTMETRDAVIPLLHKLGVSFSKAELNLHISIYWRRIEDTTLYLDAAINWLNKLKMANERSGLFPEPTFSGIISDHIQLINRSIIDLKINQPVVLKTELVEKKNNRTWKFIDTLQKLGKKFGGLFITIFRNNRNHSNPLTNFSKEWYRRLINIQDIKLIKKSPFFDEYYYLKFNPDVAKAGVDPAMHYLLHGGFEGRDPSPDFNSSWYLENNADVKHTGVNPLIHYLRFGKYEGRIAKPNT